MAKIPSPLDRRHLIEKELDASKAQAIADAYLAEDRVLEALAFLERAGATEALAEIRSQAVAAGDVFLLREVSTLTGEDPDAATWTQAADAADAAGQEFYAADARRQAARLSG